MIHVMQVSTRHNVGGVSKLINSLLSNKNTINFYITGKCEDNEKEFFLEPATESKKNIFRIQSLKRTPNLWNDSISLFALYKLIKKEKPQIIQTHMSKAGFLARLATILSRSDAKLIHSYHGLVFENYFNPILTRCLVFLERILGRYTHAFVFDSESIAEEVAHFSIRPRVTQSVIIPGLLQIDESYTPKDRDTGVLKILIVARLEQIKRIDRAMEALSLVNRFAPFLPFRVTVVGDGKLRNQLERESNKHNFPVEFVGWQSSLSTFYEESHLLLLTSDSEGTPLTIMEAAYFGCPSISTKVGGISDIIEDGRTGVLCSSNANDIAQAIVATLKYPEKLQEMARNSHEKAKKEFSEGLFLEKHLTLYQLLFSRDK